ncbi:hypothetical protein NECAME_16946 [Necator americanus]|uniref:Uncharacterized protein n=1 Tax=Necator americanus TaxID=51031 RepID=W2TTQ0_NECAM|nr:hypothetical protein NECAME_16946 [Necator americanus]ETN85029.1 hypothetical protein NECAME_16946 [Necator americanus]
MKENVVHPSCVQDHQATPSVFSFTNKLLEQDKSFLNRTFTIDTNKRERISEFKIDEALRRGNARSRSSDFRRSYKTRDDTRRACSHSIFSSSCKLPSLTANVTKIENRTCTLRPWSRTQEELRKYKEALQ